jgi:gas vesicle protein
VINKPASFFSGFFVGALASSATALLFVLQSGGKTRMQTRETPNVFSTHAEKVRAKYMEELGSWSGKGVEIKEVSAETLAEAPMGWY